MADHPARKEFALQLALRVAGSTLLTS